MNGGRFAERTSKGKVNMKTANMLKIAASAAFAMVCGVCSAWSERVDSPDGAVKVWINSQGKRLTWSLVRKNTKIFTDSEIGLEFKGQKPFGAFKVVKRSGKFIDSTWETRLYKKRFVRDFCKQMVLELEEEKPPHRKLDIHVRVYDGSVALRYGIPEQKAFKEFTVEREKTAFKFLGDPSGWFTVYPKHKDSQEQPFLHRSIQSLPKKDALIGFPAIVKLDGVYAAICEADLTDWAGLFLKRSDEKNVPVDCSQLEAEPSPRLDGNGLVVSQTPRVSPWRVVILGGTPAELTENNDVIMNLNPPPEGGEAAFSWVKPGVSAWDWWTWPRQGGLKMETEPKIAEIDFASKMGWEYYTIDAKWTGFNKIYDPKQDLTKSAEKLDLDAVLAHAKNKKVGVFLWAYWSVLESNGVERVFANLSKRGVKGLKIDFMDRQDQEMVNWYEKIVRLAAKYKLMINFHGAFHPTGMNRTWPNQITREAVAGNECFRYGWRITPELTAGLPFTRFLIGPADYTPGSFNNVLPRQFSPVNLMKDPGSLTTQEVGTRAHALALCVAYDSPLMTLCDTPGVYEGQIGLDALKKLPAAWDSTKCLGGEIGEWYSVARTAPDGRIYYAVISAKERKVDQKFTFLGPGQWRMTLYADDMQKSRKDARVVRVVKRTVTAANALALDVAPIGGAVAVFEPAAPAPSDVPPLMKTFKGEKVSTLKLWEKVRAPELLEEFTSGEYGRRPVGRPDSLVFETVEPDAEMMDGKALRKRIRATYAGKYGKGSFEFTVFIPKNKKKVPAFLLICNRNPAENIDPSRKVKSGFWPAEEIVDRGYAAIAFWNGDIAPDRNVGNREGVFACFEDPYKGRKPDAWGTLSAWGWGASRVMDWIENEPLIDARKVAVVGHSRGGKTALVTGAYDKRFAMICSNNSGCSGAKLNHIDLPDSEHVVQIMRNFPYWFCRNYVKQVNAEKDWKVDQHQFIALLAPRLVCISSATEDVWAGQEGEYYCGVLASPAWRLYGKKGLVANGFPPPEKPLQEGCISYHLRTGKHNLTPYDWKVFMDFADRHGWRK